MLYAGVGWTSAGFEVALLDPAGRAVGPARAFRAGQAGEIVSYLLRLPQPLIAAVDSTSGVLDGGMLVAGLEMYRADPAGLPRRLAFGSVPAFALAEQARSNLAALSRLTIEGGSLTGRDGDVLAGMAQSEPRLQALTSSGRCLIHGDRRSSGIALTFDDGPHPPYTGAILDVLARYGVPATFFCVGLRALGCPEDVARMVALGHTVANHTYSHPFLPDLTHPELRAQVQRTSEALIAAGAPAPTLFRPPYGSRSPAVLHWLAEMDSTIVLWDVEPSDWSMPGADAIARRVIDALRPGSIVLLHDGGGDRSQTVAALPALIEGILARGHRVVALDELRSGRASGPAGDGGPRDTP